MAETATDVTDKKLFIRFPKRVPPEEEVKRLSPYIVRVSYPRQKSARFCHIVLESKSVVPEVLKQLNKKEFKNGCLRVEMPRKLQYIKNEEKETFKENKTENTHKTNNKLSIGDGKKTVLQTEANENTHITAGKYVRRSSGKPATGGDNDRRVWITKLPFKTEDSELIDSFPGCIWARVYKSKASKSSRALCKFSTAQKAAAFVADPSKHRFNNKEIVAKLAKSQQLRGSGMKKKYGLKNENTEEENLKTESKVEGDTTAELKESKNSEESMDIEEEQNDDDDDDSESGDDAGEIDVNSSEEND